MKIFISTFGCKVNSIESSAILEDFTKAGYDISGSEQDADVVVINSCTVTAGGDKKVRQFLRHTKRLNPRCITVLCGCFPQAYSEDAYSYTEADIITGTGNRWDIFPMVREFIENRVPIHRVIPNGGKEFEPLCAKHIEGHTRGFMKLEDGCDRFCAFCVIPFARGPVRYMPLEEVRHNAEALAESGHREIVLSGINLSFYGRGAGYDLADAVKAVAEIDGLDRIRIGSVEPDLMNNEMLNRLADIEKLCPQFHMSLQSGCDKTLAAMNRHYSTADYLKKENYIRSIFKRPTFTTDVITGFPGETEADFKESLEFVKNFGFLKVHAFPYSMRPGTKAASMPGHLPNGVKNVRREVLQKECDAVRKRIISGFTGSEARIIAEQPSPEGWSGYTDRYLPALIKRSGVSNGDLVYGRITAFDGEKVIIE